MRRARTMANSPANPAARAAGEPELAQGDGHSLGRWDATAEMGGRRLVQAVAQLVENRPAGCAWSDEALGDSVEVGLDGRFSRWQAAHGRLPEAR